MEVVALGVSCLPAIVLLRERSVGEGSLLEAGLVRQVVGDGAGEPR